MPNSSPRRLTGLASATTMLGTTASSPAAPWSPRPTPSSRCARPGPEVAATRRSARRGARVLPPFRGCAGGGDGGGGVSGGGAGRRTRRGGHREQRVRPQLGQPVALSANVATSRAARGVPGDVDDRRGSGPRCRAQPVRARRRGAGRGRPARSITALPGRQRRSTRPGMIRTWGLSCRLRRASRGRRARPRRARRTRPPRPRRRGTPRTGRRRRTGRALAHLTAAHRAAPRRRAREQQPGAPARTGTRTPASHDHGPPRPDGQVRPAGGRRRARPAARWRTRRHRCDSRRPAHQADRDLRVRDPAAVDRLDLV